MFKTFALATLCLVFYKSVHLAQGASVYLCDDIQRWTGNYTEEKLVTTNSTIYDIAVSPSTGNIYVALYKSDTLLVLEHEGREINKTVRNVRTVAVDNYVPNVYVGCHDGLKIYNEITGIITEVPEVQYGIRKIIVPRNSQAFYVVTWERYEIHRYESKFTDKTYVNLQVNNRANLRFFVDVDENYYYTSTENGRTVTKIDLRHSNSTNTYDGISFVSLAEDNIGRVFGIADRSVYLLNADGTMQLLAILDFHAWYVCFDKDNNAMLTTHNEVIIFRFDYEAC